MYAINPVYSIHHPVECWLFLQSVVFFFTSPAVIHVLQLGHIVLLPTGASSR